MPKPLYLVIAGPDPSPGPNPQPSLESTLQPFLNRKKGYEVRLVRTNGSEISGAAGATLAERIRSFVLDMQSGYQGGVLLLVGDYGAVPGYPIPWGDVTINSDNYYSMPEGQLFPVLATGRLTTSDAAVLEQMIQVLTRYEDEAADENSTEKWRGRVILTGWLPRGPDAVGASFDPGFQCVDEIGEYCEIVTRFQYKTSTKYDKRDDPLGYGPLRLCFWDVEPTEDVARLISAINDGAAIIRYTGHGSGISWLNVGLCKNSPNEQVQPAQSFTATDVTALAIANGFPLVIADACQNAEMTASGSIAEIWQRALKAIGVFASDVNVKTDWADLFPQKLFREVVSGRETQTVGAMFLNAMKELHREHPTASTLEVKKFRYFGDPDTRLVRPRRKGSVAPISRKDGEVEIFSHGATGHLMHRYLNGVYGWQKWTALIPQQTEAAKVAWWTWKDFEWRTMERLEVLFLDAHRRPNHLFHTGEGGWSMPQQLGDVNLASGPVTVCATAGRLDLFALGTDGQLKHSACKATPVPGGGGRLQDVWSEWRSVHPVASMPTAVSWIDDSVHVFARGIDGTVAYGRSRARIDQFEWQELQDLQVAVPIAVSWGRGHIDVLGVGADHRLRHKAFTHEWIDCQTVGDTQLAASQPAACSPMPGRLDVFAASKRGELQHVHYQDGWSRFVRVTAFPVDPRSVSVRYSGNACVDVFARKHSDDHLIHVRYRIGGGYQLTDVTPNAAAQL